MADDARAGPAGDSRVRAVGGVKPFWRNEEHGLSIYCGDCLEVMRQLPTRASHAVLTDPPYSSGTRREASKGIRKSMNRETEADDWFMSDCLTTGGFEWLLRSCGLEWRRLLIPGGHILVFIDWRMADYLSRAIESADLRRIDLIVWDKQQIGMGQYFRNQHELLLHFTNGKSRAPQRRDVPNVLQCKPVGNDRHPTEKPLPLTVTLMSVIAGVAETVIDPFCGSGTTLAAAYHSRRHAIGIEADERYCELAAKRLEDELAQGRLFEPSEVAQPTQEALALGGE